MQNDHGKLAADHVEWLSELLKFVFDVWMPLTKKLMHEEFLHGLKHGRELERENWIKAGAALGPEAGPDTGAGQKSKNEKM